MTRKPKEETGQVCANCNFWEPTQADEGECRMDTPATHCVPMIGYPNDIQVMGKAPVTIGSMVQTVWPTTKAGKWCGCWVPLGGVPVVGGKRPTAVYGVSHGSLCVDEMIGELALVELANDLRVRYGGRYLIGESMSEQTAVCVADSLGYGLTIFDGDSMIRVRD